MLRSPFQSIEVSIITIMRSTLRRTIGMLGRNVPRILGARIACHFN